MAAVLKTPFIVAVPQPCRRSWARRLLCLIGLLPVVACVEANPPAVDFGTVIDVRPAEMAGSISGAGTLTGAAAGGIIGSRFGGGAGVIATTLAGVIAGGATGTAVETSLQSSSGLQYTVKLDRGYVSTVVQHREPDDPILMPGARVKLETRGRDQRVLPADRLAGS